MNHTPAPWKLEGGKHDWFISGNDGHDIVTLSRLPSEVNMANAAVIIVAPNMLAELKEIDQGWDVRVKRTRGTEPLNLWEEERHRFVKKVIAQASGDGPAFAMATKAAIAKAEEKVTQ